MILTERTLLPAKPCIGSLFTLAASATLLVACGGGGEQTATVAAPQAAVCATHVDRRATVLATDAALQFNDTDILRFGFTDPVATDWLLTDPVRTVTGIRAANNATFMFAEGFENGYECITVQGATELSNRTGTQHAVRVDFSYRGTVYAALAYGRLPGSCGARSAALVIPGSGLNQATSIVNRDAANVHHGILDALGSISHTYALIKPNEDALAWHDGNGAKLTGDMIWNYHVNRGGSYSVSYLTQSLAFVKWMKSCFDQTVVAGVSQGGAATLINALQSKPTAAVVSSGHSLLFDQVEYAGHNQLLNVPGYASLAKSGTLVKAMTSSPTAWLFTWGRAELDIYKVEADTGFTASYIEPLPQVDVNIHDGGHEFPIENVRAFISRTIFR